MSKQRKFAGRVLRVAAVTGIALGVFAPAAAHADCYPNACVSPKVDDPGASVKAATTSKSSTLPFTGGDVAGLAVLGIGAVSTGAVFVRHSRRK